MTLTQPLSGGAPTTPEGDINVAATTSVRCTACGSAATGKFCSNCGSALLAVCRSCGVELASGKKFCHECGAAVGKPASATNAKPWIIAGGTVVVAGLVMVVWFTAARPPAQQPQPTTIGPATTDISQMSPREQADRLFNRVMAAQERGDGQEVTFFSPMAIQAYGLLGTMDNDARYHLGLLHTVGGPVEMALLQADSLEQQAPGHLFASMLRATAASVRNDPALLRQAYQEFLDNYEREMAIARPEYADHPNTVDTFLNEARSAVGGAVR